MAERNAQFLQIALGHIWQDFEIDGILGKGGRVLGEPNPIKPGFYLVIVAHCRVCPPKVLLHFPFKFTPHIALRSRRERPRRRRAAEQRDEVAASHVGHRRAPVQPACSACHKTGGESFSRRDSEAATGGNGLKRAVISYAAGYPSPFQRLRATASRK